MVGNQDIELTATAIIYLRSKPDKPQATVFKQIVQNRLWLYCNSLLNLSNQAGAQKL